MMKLWRIGKIKGRGQVSEKVKVKGKELLFAFTSFLVIGLAMTANAGVVGWWRFNGEETNVPNVANPGTLDGTIVSISNDVSGAVADVDAVGFGSDTAKMPSVTTILLK